MPNMKHILIVAALAAMLGGCTRGGHVYLGNAPICPTRASVYDGSPNSDYLKGAIVCLNSVAYEAKKDHPPVGPPSKEWWRVY